MRAPTMTEAGDELPAFEPPSRPDVAGGLLEARLTTNGGAGAPRTVQFGARAQQLKLLPIAAVTGIKRSPATPQDIVEVPETATKSTLPHAA